MKKVKYTSIILLGVFLLNLMACSNYPILAESAEQRLGKTIEDDKIIVYNSDLYDITVVGFKSNFDIVYEPQQPSSLKQAGQKQPYLYIINGSYFEGSRVHAGWLSIFGVEQTPLKKDRQLTHMAVLDTTSGRVDFYGLDVWDTSWTRAETIEFQTGPLVIDSNSLDTLSINASINGKSAHLRTLLAYTAEDTMKYFIISRQPGSLDQMGEYLLSLPLFQGKTLSVMNLDGGSSTALFSQKHPELNFNVKRPLPILLGIK